VFVKSISIIILICVFVLIGVTAYIAFQNRNSEALRSKVVPGIAIVLVGACFTIWFSLKSETISRQFTSTLFFHKQDKLPLDEYCKDDYKFGGYQFRIELLHFIKDRIEQDEELKKATFNSDRNKIEEFYHDLVLVKLLSRFSWMYADWWDVQLDSVRRGRSFTSSVSPVKPIASSMTLKLEDYLETLDSNDKLRKLLELFLEQYPNKKITLPPKTKVGILKSEYTKALLLTNPFVRVSIAVDGRGGSIGLGDYQWFLGYDRKESENFWSEHLRVRCEAKFERFRSGHPEMPKYKRWVETMFAEVEEQLGDEKRLERARDYRDLIGQ